MNLHSDVNLYTRPLTLLVFNRCYMNSSISFI